MVVFLPLWCRPEVVQVYSTVVLTPNLTSIFQHDFNVGSFAQFGDPFEVVRIDNHTERTDFRNISHLAIRQRLDAENFTDEFILLDEYTAQSHAIWWVTTTQDSQYDTSYYTDLGYPPVVYPGENLTLWQSHILIQDIALEYERLSVGSIDIGDIIPGRRIYPYDPHEPQELPFTQGYNYATKEGAGGLYGGHPINATFSEVMYTTDPAITRSRGIPPPPGCVALTPEAARLSGLLSADEGINHWWPWYDGQPRPGDVIRLTAYYDWDSPRWPPPGVAAGFPGPTAGLSLASGIRRHPRVRFGQQCVRRNRRRPEHASQWRNAIRTGIKGDTAAL